MHSHTWSCNNVFSLRGAIWQWRLLGFTSSCCPGVLFQRRHFLYRFARTLNNGVGKCELYQRQGSRIRYKIRIVVKPVLPRSEWLHKFHSTGLASPLHMHAAAEASYDYSASLALNFLSYNACACRLLSCTKWLAFFSNTLINKYFVMKQN